MQYPASVSHSEEKLKINDELTIRITDLHGFHLLNLITLVIFITAYRTNLPI